MPLSEVAQNPSVRKVKRVLLLPPLPELATRGITEMEGTGARLESQGLLGEHRGLAENKGRELNKGLRPRMLLSGSASPLQASTVFSIK